MSNVIVLCTGNSCRSQMAEGFLRKFLDPIFMVYSAGIETRGLHPMAVKVMKERKIDIADHRSSLVSEYDGIEFDYVITVCNNAKENCPFIPFRISSVHKDFPDPAMATGSRDKVLDEFRTCRDQIEAFCRQLAGDINPKHTG